MAARIMNISIIIISYNTEKLLLDCISSIYRTVNDLSFEIIVSDNGSKDNSCKSVRDNFPGIKILENGENLGFAKACNVGAKKAFGDILVFLNTDTILKFDAIKKLHYFLSKTSDAGVCGPQLLNEDGSKQNSFDNYPTFLSVILNKTLLRFLFRKKYPSKLVDFSDPIEVESLVGACFCVKKKVFEELNGFDEDYFFLFEETDFCLRAKEKGYNIYLVPDSNVVHLQGKSSEANLFEVRKEYLKNRYLFLGKHFYKIWQIKILAFIVGIRLLVNGIFTILFNREKGKIYFRLFCWNVNFFYLTTNNTNSTNRKIKK
ncbi:glycosyltransferase family 2 protein [bacterium]|nr:glycosyltransferase family 2 protein [bacterium]